MPPRVDHAALHKAFIARKDVYLPFPSESYFIRTLDYPTLIKSTLPCIDDRSLIVGFPPH